MDATKDGRRKVTEIEEKVEKWELAETTYQEAIRRGASWPQTSDLEWIVTFRLAEIGRAYLRSIGKNVGDK